MKRRHFIKSGALFVPTIFVPRLIRAQANTYRDISWLINRNSTAAGGGAFTYYSAVFDGTNDWLSRASNLTGIADGKAFTLSFWFEAKDNFSTCRLLYEDSGYFNISRDGSDLIAVTGYTPAAAVTLSLVSTIQIDNDSLWHHVFISADLAQAGKSFIYIDGVDRTTRTTHNNNAMNFTSGGWGVGANSAGATIMLGNLCEYYFTNTFLDPSAGGTIAKFASGGKPISLGSDGSTPTGTQPLVYFKTQPTNWNTNTGSGGAFVQNGSITDGGSDKP